MSAGCRRESREREPFHSQVRVSAARELEVTADAELNAVLSCAWAVALRRALPLALRVSRCLLDHEREQWLPHMILVGALRSGRAAGRRNVT